MAHVGLLEDNTRIAKMCATMLQYAGHQVTVYEHPRECLAALLSHALPQENYVDAIALDVLILDLHLPDMSGFDVLRHLSTNPGTQSLSLIFCTAATPSEVGRALRMAPQAIFIEKPFTFQQLVDAVVLAVSA